ncbi:MAG: hypothetical protein ACSLFI_06475 [Solirubrobacterales bacterium]
MKVRVLPPELTAGFTGGATVATRATVADGQITRGEVTDTGGSGPKLVTFHRVL